MLTILFWKPTLLTVFQHEITFICLNVFINPAKVSPKIRQCEVPWIVTVPKFPENSLKNYRGLYRSLRSSRPEVFLRKCFLEICSNFTGEHPCWSVISVKLQSNFIEIKLRHGCSPVNLLHISRTPFPKNTSGRLLLDHTNCLRWSFLRKQLMAKSR